MATADADLAEKHLRAFVTPEGVDLRIALAGTGERAAAFLLDLAFIVGALIAVTVVLFVAGVLAGFQAFEFMAAVWLLAFFFLRNFYFMASEMTARAATPGKRILGLRVATRDGSSLSADAIFARNAMRELEVFLPLSFLVTQATAVDAWISIAAGLWCAVFVFFPLFNKDGLRVGDIAAGTWVVRAPRRLLDVDLAAKGAQGGLVFTSAALDAYGIKELSVLEEVLRRKDSPTMAAVARRIRAKIGATDKTPDEVFLNAYYAGLRGRLEQRLLFGRRRKDKFDKV